MVRSLWHCSAALLVCGGARLLPGATALQAPDSQAVERAARRAQADFELTRRAHLPLRSGPSGPCDAHIGRFCYWYEEADNSAPEEPVAIGRARERLIAALGQGAALLPGDEWIAGQQVRYLLEAGQPRAALAALQACRTPAWWCGALAGLARHAAQDFAAADSSFDAALRDMPPPERCRWTDIAVLLEGQLRKAYERSSCEGRAAFAARWWWLAKPLLSQPGNDRRTEHYARVTLARIEERASNPYGARWGDDMREMLLRYGEPSSWTADRPATTLPELVIMGHERTPGFHFGPGPHALADPATAQPEDWAVRLRAPRERYAPVYAARIVSLAPLVAVFRRRDSLLVVASYDLSRDSGFGSRAVRAALILAHDEKSVFVAEHDTVASGRDVLLAAAPLEPVLLGLEVVATTAGGGRSMARARFGLGHTEPASPELAARLSLSDVLLFEPRDSMPATLREALPFVYGSARIPAGRRLGLFWEIYGLDPATELVTTSLALTEEHGGWLRRAFRSVGLAARRRAVQLRWDELAQPRDGVAPRALALDLSGLGAGRYRLELTVIAAGGDSVTATREFEVLRH